MASKLGSVDPSKHPDEEFDLYSIPAFDDGGPVRLQGQDIGSSKQIVAPGDILLSKIVPHIRRSWVVGPSKGRRIIASGEWIVFRSPQVDPRYLRHTLVSDPFHAEFMATVSGVGGSLLRARPVHVAQIPIPLPPLVEQGRIADILDRADALRALRHEALGRLDDLIQGFFSDLITDSRRGSWDQVGLPHAFWFQEGPGVRNWQFTTTGIKLLNVGNIEKDGRLNLSTTNRHLAETEAYGKYKHFLVDSGDLVIASSGISFDKDGLLRTRGAFVSDLDLPLCMNTSTIRFKAISGVSDLRYLWVWLNSREFRVQITRQVTGSAQQNFGPSHLSKTVITLPPLAIQQTFAERVERIERVGAAMRAHAHQLDAVFASLQHRAFRGEL